MLLLCSYCACLSCFDSRGCQVIGHGLAGASMMRFVISFWRMSLMEAVYCGAARTPFSGRPVKLQAAATRQIRFWQGCQ